MDLTTILAQIYGPVLLAIGLGVFVSRKYYIKIYRDLEKETLAVLTFGIVAMAAGIVQISFHNVWNTFPQMVISFLGWGLLLKGALFAIAPGIVDRSGDWWANMKLIPTAGILMLVVGAYLSWIGYLA